MWHAGLVAAQAGIQIAGKDINNLSYAYDTTLMAEREEKLYWCFSFWLTSLCIIGSSFIHLISIEQS